MLHLTVICYLLSAACLGSPVVSPRILGGNDAAIGDVPFTATIEWSDYGHLCGAAIISVDWLLIDAWCVYPMGLELYRVRVGSATSGSGTLHSIVEWRIHPYADVLKHDYDFALVKVDPPFVFNANVAAAALPALNEETPDGVVGVIAGWGRVDVNAGTETVSKLQAADVTLLSDADCSTFFGLDYNERILCAQGAEAEVALCWRDEGGPLVYNGTLFGIALLPPNCSEALDVQKFGRVASVRDWIDYNLEIGVE